MAVPDRVLTNHDLEAMVETTDEWIISRTGIRERRIVGRDDSTTSLATDAARSALARAGRTPQDIDLIVVGTATPDDFLVSQACMVQAELGGTGGAFRCRSRLRRIRHRPFRGLPVRQRRCL